MIRKLRFSIIIICLSFLSCQYFELMNYKDWLVKSGNDEVDIYITGRYNSPVPAVATACYWENGGEPIELENGNPGQASNIFIDGNDIYICGTYQGVVGSGSEKACYWKNGKFFPLISPSTISYSTDIIVNDGILYILGNIGSGNTRITCYWINGEINFPNPDIYSAAGNMKIVDNDIYFCGLYYSGVDYFACYWKNNKIFPLPTSEAQTCAYSILIYNGDILVCGDDRLSGNLRACYWKNGIRSNYLSASPSDAFAMFIDKGDLYIGGHISYTNSFLWKNGVITLLPGSGTPGSNFDGTNIQDMIIFNDSIYMSGFANDVAGGHAAFWKGTNQMDFLPDSGGTNRSHGMGIAVKYSYIK